MLKATLNQEVSKTVDHERIGLVCDSLNNVIFLFGGAHLELLLKKNRGLLVVVADDFVHYIFPVARDIFIKESTIIKWFMRRNVCLDRISTRLAV